MALAQSAAFMVVTERAIGVPHVGETLVGNGLVLTVFAVCVQSRVECVHSGATDCFANTENPLDSGAKLIADIVVACHCDRMMRIVEGRIRTLGDAEVFSNSRSQILCFVCS